MLFVVLIDSISFIAFCISSDVTTLSFVSSSFLIAPAMSIISIALSGNLLFIRYLDESFTIFVSALFS